MQKEFATTQKVMKAFPEEHSNLTPHEKSSSAEKLMKTFVFEMYLMEYALGGTLETEKFQTYNPGSIASIITDFSALCGKILEKLNAATDEDMDKTVPFAGKDFKAHELLTMLLFDQIHHRGQLTVYIRLAGGQVPSVYGPSADDDSTNL